MTAWPYLMSPDTAAAYLDVSRETFRRLVRPYLPVVYVGEASPRFRIEDVQRWADQVEAEEPRLRRMALDNLRDNFR